MSDPFVPVVIAAAELKRSNPVGYGLFVKSIEALAEAAVFDLVAADKDKVFYGQGKAQVLVELAKKLDDCAALDQKYKTRT